MDTSRAHAEQLDAADDLRQFRDRFHIPRNGDSEAVYLCGNSLGLQPKTARAYLEQEIDDWAHLAVGGHRHGVKPWYSYHEAFCHGGARLVGAQPSEVVMMNSLTVNLHLMMVSFYRPTPQRHKILIDAPCFPSDLYAVKTQMRLHGFDPTESLIEVGQRDGEHLIRTSDIQDALAEHGDQIALVLLGGVNYFTGQVLDMAAIADAANSRGCCVGFDLAHAAGNVPLALHEWGVDFACWCSYKYLNAGPGAIAGCFVHERHGNNEQLLRFGGWWGNDPETRFDMHLRPEFLPQTGAAGWQLSNPPILSLAPLHASLELFDEATMPALRSKSMQLTGYLRDLLEQGEKETDWCQIITPRDPESQGCQLSLLVLDRPGERVESLLDAGIVCDFREPNVIRVAPVPLYNSFTDVWRFAQTLQAQPSGAQAS
jgi:kynureninase